MMGRPKKNSPPKKKRAIRHYCSCNTTHGTEIECELARMLSSHISVVMRLLADSDLVTIHVIELGLVTSQAFTIHKTLLSIHSTYFSRLFDEPEDMEKIEFKWRSEAFHDFVIWLYTGNTEGGLSTVHDNWMLGAAIGSPLFQNYQMSKLLSSAAISNTSKSPQRRDEFVLSATNIDLLYEKVFDEDEERSPLPKAIADIFACNNPLNIHESGTEPHQDWARLLSRRPEIGMDILRVNLTEWNGTQPWDKNNRGAYMIDYSTVNQAWKTHILKRGAGDNIQSPAKNSLLRSYEASFLKEMNDQEQRDREKKAKLADEQKVVGESKVVGNSNGRRSRIRVAAEDSLEEDGKIKSHVADSDHDTWGYNDDSGVSDEN